MSKILYIKASPRAGFSYSVKVADAFLETYKSKNLKDEIMTLDIFKKDMPTFDGFTLQAKYAILNGKEHTKEEKNAWSAVENAVNEFKSADKYLFAIPMWNFGIPYRLKQYFDVIVQPGYTFSFSPQEGYKGLVTGKPVVCVYARGGEYAHGTQAEGLDLQKKYMDIILGFIGFKDVRSIIVEPTLAGGPQVAAKKQEEAINNARKIAEKF